MTRIDTSTINTNIRLHQWLEQHISKDMTCIDMTCGLGNDTHLLSKLAAHVYSFDIQRVAVEQAQLLCQDQNNITFICDDHKRIDDYVNDSVHCVVYNLGYLPNGNKSIITQSESTLISLSKVNRLLVKNGYLIITVYPGHAGGKKESELVKQWINHHVEHQLMELIQIFNYPKNNTPTTYIVRKLRTTTI